MPTARLAAHLTCCFALLGFLAACTPAPPDAGSPPVPPPGALRQEVVDAIHGIDVADPYRWLEEIESPEVLSWVQEQDRFARRTLGSDTHGLERIRKRLEADTGSEDMSLPLRRDHLLFFMMTSPEYPSPALLLRDLRTGTTRVLANPGAGSVIRDFRPDPSGRTLAYAIQEKETGRTTWSFRDLESGRDLPAHLTDVSIHGEPWVGDGAGFVTYSPYSRQEGLPARVHLQDLAVPSRSRVIFENKHSPTAGLRPDLAGGGRFLVVSTFEESSVNRVFLQRLAPAGDTGHEPLEIFAGRRGSHTYVGSRSNTLFFLTTHQSPKGRLVSVTLLDDGSLREETLVAEGEHPLTEAYVYGGRFLSVTVERGFPVLRIIRLDGTLQATLHPPRGLLWNDHPTGWPAFSGGPQNQAYFRSLALLDAGVYEIDMAEGTLTRFHGRGAPLPRERYSITQISYTSHDGVDVPMTVISHKDPSPEAHPPVLINVYGSYGFTFLPFFNPMFRLFLESGGVYAVPNIRGGGIHGEDWYDAGRGVNKRNSVMDTVHAARWLLDTGMTVPGRLAVMGNSAGSIPAAVAALRNPGIFGALLLEVPLSDMIRYRNWTSDWNTEFAPTDTPELLQAALEISPYHLLDGPLDLPPVMITAGDKDRIANVAHAYKLAAALRHAQAGTAPPLLHIDWGTGHGANKTMPQRIETWAYEIAFLFDALKVDLD